MQIDQTVNSYYQSLEQQKDWQDFWSENAVFADASGALKAVGKAAVIKSFTPFLQTVATVKQMLIEGEKTCAIATYQYVNARGETLTQDVAEILEVKDGKLQKLTLYFDLSAYRKFVSGS